MSFNPVTLEVDGTLRNPVVLGAVIAWAILLAFVFAASLRVFRSRWAVGIIVVVALAVTPTAQDLLVNVYYFAQDFSGTGLRAPTLHERLCSARA